MLQPNVVMALTCLKYALICTKHVYSICRCMAHGSANIPGSLNDAIRWLALPVAQLEAEGCPGGISSM